MAMSWLGFKNALVGTKWAVSLLLCVIRLRKQSSHLVGLPFLALKVFLTVWTSCCWLRALTINQWVWLRSLICTGYLQGHLCEVWCLKPGSMVHLRAPWALK